MKIENIEAVEVEISRLQSRIEAAKLDLDNEWVGPSANVAALRRASLDLTRALSKMRNEKD